MSDKRDKNPRRSTAAKKREAKKRPTLRQSRFAKALMHAKTLKEAAIEAGYSEKYATSSARQALASLRPKVQEMMDNAGLSVPVLIQKHLIPKLSAKTTKLATEDGNFTDFVELEDHATQLQALDMSFKLHGAYVPKDPKEAAQFGVEVIVVDIPRPSVHLPDFGPGAKIDLSPYETQAPEVISTNGKNGHKPPEK